MVLQLAIFMTPVFQVSVAWWTPVVEPEAAAVQVADPVATKGVTEEIVHHDVASLVAEEFEAFFLDDSEGEGEQN